MAGGGIEDDVYLARIKAELKQVFRDCHVYLFGSRSAARNVETSDYDIGVLATRDISRDISIARERLEASNIPFTVDVVDLNATSREFAQKVQREGILLWRG